MTDSISSTRKKRKLLDWRPAFLEEFARTGNATLAAKAAGVDRTMAYIERKGHPEFAAAWQEAREQAAEVLEAEAWRRAHDGTSKPVFYQGQVCGAVQEYSDVLLIFLLKGAKPDVYRENVNVNGRLGVEHSGSVANLSIGLGEWRSLPLAERIRLLQSPDNAPRLLPDGSDVQGA